MITPSPKVKSKTRMKITSSESKQLTEQKSVNNTSNETEPERSNSRNSMRSGLNSKVGKLSKKQILSKLINTQTKQCTIQLFSPVKKETSQSHNTNNISLNNTSESNSKNISTTPNQKESSSFETSSNRNLNENKCHFHSAGISVNNNNESNNNNWHNVKSLRMQSMTSANSGNHQKNDTSNKKMKEASPKRNVNKMKEIEEQQTQMKQLPYSKTSLQNLQQFKYQTQQNKKNNISKYVVYPTSLTKILPDHYHPSNQPNTLPQSITKHHTTNSSEHDLNKESNFPPHCLQSHTWTTNSNSTQMATHVQSNVFNTLNTHANANTNTKGNANRNLKQSQKSFPSLACNTMHGKKTLNIATNKNTDLVLPSECPKSDNNNNNNKTDKRDYKKIFELLNSNLKEITELIKRTQSLSKREVLEKEKEKLIEKSIQINCEYENLEKFLQTSKDGKKMIQISNMEDSQEQNETLQGEIIPPDTLHLYESVKTAQKDKKAISLKRNAQYIGTETKDSPGGIQIEDSFLFSSFNSEMYRNLMNEGKENKDVDYMSYSYDLNSMKSNTINMNLMAIAFANIGEKKIREKVSQVACDVVQCEKTEKTECQYEDVAFNQFQNRVINHSLSAVNSMSRSQNNDRWLLEIETQNDVTYNIMDQSKGRESIDRVPISELKKLVFSPEKENKKRVKETNSPKSKKCDIF